MGKISFFACLLAVFVLATISSQAYVYTPFSKIGNLKLKDLKTGDTIKEMNDMYGNAFCQWATSTLPAEGKAPKKPKEFKEPEDEWDYDAQLSEWETMYAANRLTDGKIETAWCAGVNSGINEAVMADVDPAGELEIFAGFGRDKKIWEENNRPKDILVSVLEASNAGATQNATFFMDIKVLAQKPFTLDNTFGYQKLPIPEFTPGENKHRFIVIKILSVYKGKKYNDTLISEIRTKQ